MKSKFELLYNPFTKIAGWKAFAIGALIVSISVIIACDSSQYYQGVMNIKLVKDMTLGLAFAHQALGLISMIAVFYAAALIFSKGVRFQDILGTITLARFPYIIPAFLGYFTDFDSINELTKTMLSANPSVSLNMILFLVITAIVMTVVLIWYIALLWNAFRVSADIRGGKGVAIFIGALILSDGLYYLLSYIVL